MEKRAPKVWHCKWSDRKHKVYYINVVTKESSWKRPDNFVETQNELNLIKSWKLKANQKQKETQNNASISNGNKNCDETKLVLTNGEHKSTENLKQTEKDTLSSEDKKEEESTNPKEGKEKGEVKEGEEKELIKSDAATTPGANQTPPHQVSEKLEKTPPHQVSEELEKTPPHQVSEELEKTPPKEYFESTKVKVITPEDKTLNYASAVAPDTPTDKGSVKRRLKTDNNVCRSKRSRVAKNRSGETMIVNNLEKSPNRVEDFVEVYSDKRGMIYYYNLRTKTSQWKRPACMQAADTQRAIEKARLKKDCQSPKLTILSDTSPGIHSKYQTFTNENLYFGRLLKDSFDEDKEEDDEEGSEVEENGREEEGVEQEEEGEDILCRTTLNVNAPCFEMGRKLNVNATPFFPKTKILSRDNSPEVTISPQNRSTNTTPSRNDEVVSRAGRRKVTVKRRLSDPSILKKSSERVTVKDRLSLPDSTKVTRSVHDRLGVRTVHSNNCNRAHLLLNEAPSNVRLLSKDLVRLSFLPPHPDTEKLRWGEVQVLRLLFSKLCESKLGLEEPTEALNRWLLEQQLSSVPQCDPLLCFSDKKSVSLYREIMQDVPMKCKLPRSMRTCTDTCNKFVAKMRTVADSLSEKDRTAVSDKCNAALSKNVEFSDTRALIKELRESCQEVSSKYYKPIVEEICETMNQHCKASAEKVEAFARNLYDDELTNCSPSSATQSTSLVLCRPAQPPIPGTAPRGNTEAVMRDGMCKITYEDATTSINVSHFKKLQNLYAKAGLDDSKDEDLFHCRVWCLMKRYKMLRSSMTGGKLQSENFGLHAALPRKAFELLNRKFHVTFECFASPFNCYFSQYCSAFPDIDCYFGSRGSFFNFKPKSGSFQANPPFSEEVMLAMANHMIGLLDDTTESLMFVVFIPDWQQPLTPAIPRLANTIYCTHNILLESGNHQYITGNQHVQGLAHYDAVHGTQVYVLQNDSAADTWPVYDADMYRLRDAMSYNHQWG